MTTSPTLNSRLRVLIAKTFRAEKLYSAIRNVNCEKLTSVTSLAEVANDIRAKEWQKTHYQLRVALNEVLALGNNGAVVAELIQLREHFVKVTQASSAEVERGIADLVETARRSEFTHVFKSSVELIRQKARLQANKVVVDELSALLEASGKNVSSLNSFAAERDKNGAEETNKQQSEPTVRSNVIPLKRRFASGAQHNQ